MASPNPQFIKKFSIFYFLRFASLDSKYYTDWLTWLICFNSELFNYFFFHNKVNEKWEKWLTGGVEGTEMR